MSFMVRKCPTVIATGDERSCEEPGDLESKVAFVGVKRRCFLILGELAEGNVRK